LSGGKSRLFSQEKGESEKSEEECDDKKAVVAESPAMMSCFHNLPSFLESDFG
jgi:hypothetical protein